MKNTFLLLLLFGLANSRSNSTGLLFTEVTEVLKLDAANKLTR